MAINFPASPTVDDTYTYLDQTWICTSADPVIWKKSAATETGNTEGNTGEVAYYDTVGSIIKGATAFYYDSTNLKVGIGTSGPTETLDVRGGITASGGLSVAGATFANDIKVNDLTVGKGGGDVAANTAVGYAALYANTEGDNNVASGYAALFSNTGGDSNVASGSYALFLNTEGGSNVAVGSQALRSNTEGNYNVASGRQALFSNTEGDYNIASGSHALYNNTEGDSNIATGYQALYNNTEGDYNIATGYQALYNNTEGDYNVASGSHALFSNTTGINNIAYGYAALYANTDGNYNSALGNYALYLNTEGHYNVASGYQALRNNTEGDSNVASGFKSLYLNTEGNYNSALGNYALFSNTGGDSNVASGYQALYSNTDGNNNVASGRQALYYNTEGGSNVAVGFGALTANTDGNNNVASGRQALASNTGGDYNSALGYQAGNSILGSNNTAIGKDAGYDRFNDYIGSNNTYLGHNAQPSSATASNEIVLGDSNVTLIHSAAGMSMGGGATFGGVVNISGAGNYILFPDGTTMGTLTAGANGATGATGADGTNGATGATGATGPVGNYVESWNGLTGAVDVTSSTIHVGGISADAGATFGGDVAFQGGISAAGATIGGYWAGVQEETIGISVNNGSSVLTTGVKGHRTIPYACDIIDWRVTSTDSGAIEWGINYCTYANFPTMTANAIHHSEAPGIAATGSKDESAGTIAGGNWTKYQFDAGDIIEFEIDSVTTLTNCILELTIRRTS